MRISLAAAFRRPHRAWRQYRARTKAAAWERNGRIPNARGYAQARRFAIDRGIASTDGGRYGWSDVCLDERVVEYPWTFDRLGALHKPNMRILDAGSVLNHEEILDKLRRAGYGPLSIVTLAYEGHAHVSTDVRYEFADLRELPYRDEWFGIVVCLSTLEHVGMDNTNYGGPPRDGTDAGAEAARAMAELRRVTVVGGTLLLSVPFGRRSDRGWLRIFDADDLDRLIQVPVPGWSVRATRFFRSTPNGWRESAAEGVRDAGYNEHPNRRGVQDAPAWVSAAEAVALVELRRTR